MIMRILAVLFLAAAIAAGINDLASEGSGLASLGELWFALSPGSLNLSQAVTQRYLAPEIWDPGVIWVLEKPAVAVLGIVFLIFFAIAAIFSRGSTGLEAGFESNDGGGDGGD